MSERTGSSQEIEFSLLAFKISRNIPDRPSRTEVEPVLPRVPPSRASVAVLPHREIEFLEEEATVVQVRPAPRTPAPTSGVSREEAATYLRNYQQNLLSTKKQYRRGSYLSCGVLLFAILFYLSPSEWYLGISQEIPVVEAEDAQAVSQGMLYPLPSIFRISSPFGDRIHPISRQRRLHAGIDFAAPKGTSVLSVFSATVLHAGAMDGYGNTVIISTDDSRWLYAHLNEVHVREGEAVKRGQIVGTVGSTGVSTGPHLHLEKIVWSEDANDWVKVDFALELQQAKDRLLTVQEQLSLPEEI